MTSTLPPASSISPANANGTLRRVLELAALELQEHQVDVAHDGPTAVVSAARLSPDVALVDIGLPGLDGYEVARRIRAQAKGRPVRLVALTGYGQPEDRRRAEEAGFDAHLVKPVDPDQLALAPGGTGLRATAGS